MTVPSWNLALPGGLAGLERGEIPTRKTVLGVIKHGVHYSSETPEHYTPRAMDSGHRRGAAPYS